MHTRYIKNTQMQDMIRSAMESIDKHKRLSLLFLFIISYAAGFVYLSQTPSKWPTGEQGPDRSLVAVLAAIDHVSNDGSRSTSQETKISDCRARGPLPDPDCTPGATFTVATSSSTETLANICKDGYSATVRKVSAGLKKKIYKAYGITYPQPFGSYELDHLIPLALGGSNDPANLFPEAAGTKTPGFREKDIVENYLHMQVCAGFLDLSSAQRAISIDWISIYESINPVDREAIKKQYGSWADRSSY